LVPHGNVFQFQRAKKNIIDQRVERRGYMFIEEDHGVLEVNKVFLVINGIFILITCCSRK
jgi:hypothetical protein